VLGHSLNDAPVMRVLRNRDVGARFALTYFETPFDLAVSGAHQTATSLDEAIQLQVDFGPDAALPGEEIDNWLRGEPAPKG
jgi:hypothetical protein